VDEQRFGPYRFWHHQHLFRATGHSVEVRDVVHYLLPGGFVGRPFSRSWVRRRLEAIFAYRQEAVRRLLEGGEPRRPSGTGGGPESWGAGQGR
jgi:ligand-binding SRPBCC domain-containing protein